MKKPPPVVIAVESWFNRLFTWIVGIGGAVAVVYWIFSTYQTNVDDIAEMRQEIAPAVQAMIQQRDLEQERLKVLCSMPEAKMPPGYCKGFDVTSEPE